MIFCQNEKVTTYNIWEWSKQVWERELDHHRSWYGPVTNRFWNFSFFHRKKSMWNQTNFSPLCKFGKNEKRSISLLDFPAKTLIFFETFQQCFKRIFHLVKWTISEEKRTIHQPSLSPIFFKVRRICWLECGKNNEIQVSRFFYVELKKQVTRGWWDDVWVFQTSSGSCLGHFQSFTFSLVFF